VDLQQGPDPNHLLSDIDLATMGNAYLAYESFESFRRAVRPNVAHQKAALVMRESTRQF
jgi:hypothetical protein